jgi:hypothetical protein
MARLMDRVRRSPSFPELPRWLLILALTGGVLGIAIGELLQRGFRRFWQEHPFTTNVVASVFMILIGATVIERLLNRAAEKRRRDITYTLMSPLLQQLEKMNRGLRRLVDETAERRQTTAEQLFRDSAASRDELWQAELRNQLAASLPELRRLHTTYAPALSVNETPLEFLAFYDRILDGLEKEYAHLEAGTSGAGSLKTVEQALSRIARALDEARKLSRADEPSFWRPELGVEGKGLMFVGADGYDIRTWPLVGDAPTHSEALDRFNLDHSTVVVYFRIAESGALKDLQPTGVKRLSLNSPSVEVSPDTATAGAIPGLSEHGDHEGAQLKRDELIMEICRLDPRLHEPSRVGIAEQYRLDR